MRFLALAALGLAIGCGSVAPMHDGGGAGGSGSGGMTGVAGTTGSGGTGGSGGIVCILGGVSHPGGTTFPSPDGCNTCTCTLDGQIACTERACPPDGGTTACAFDASYTYGNIGGFVPYQDEVVLTPPAGYVYTRNPLITTPPSISCAPALPACNATDAIDVADIMRDIADPDVQYIFGRGIKPGPVLGYDTRPVDGQVFSFVRADGFGFLMGSPCPSTTMVQCAAIPAGIAKLVADLRALDQQQLKDASCAALR